MTASSESWEKFLPPDTLKGNLIAISLFITAYEMFKDSIVEKPITLFTNGFDEHGPTIDDEYKTDVFARSKSKLYASLLWLKEMEAIEQSDIEVFDSIRQHRYEVAPEPMELLANSRRNLDITKFRDLTFLLIKIENGGL
jgi:hypothetical protein